MPLDRVMDRAAAAAIAAWSFPGMSIADIPKRSDEIRAAYRRHGVVVFPGMLARNDALQGFLSAVRFLFGRIMARHGESVAPDEDLGEILVRLKAIAAIDGQIVADMGTQHNKLVEANRLKYADFVVELLKLAFGAEAVLATPQAGDTLHLFMPGEAFHRYNLPVHQDYPYLMQSPAQATLYLGLSKPHPGAGGLEFWPGSQSLGVLPCAPNAYGAFEVTDSDEVLRDFPREQYFWDVGDVGLFDSLMCHRSIPSTAPDRGRVVQIFRYSDLRHPLAETYDWRSSWYPRRSAAFEDFHPDLYRPAPLVQAERGAPHDR
ncbi:MAG TPA: phytanoyl-CoA dioxygenase family protein [Caulobacteraceae bacterium]|nr:phytanoyl-CoA dioxygenase family protein [Caulobacteraceae bacterium]